MQANLDFSLDGGECRTDDRGKFYLWSGSPYIIQHDGGGANMRISTSCYLGDQREEYSFDPLVSAPGLGGGVAVGDMYDSTYTGAFANGDTTVVLERTFFAPRNKPDNPSFMVCKTVMYSGDGQAHDNITIGSFSDWDIPSVVTASNTVGVSPPASSAGQFVYAQGSDVDTSEANLICQPNVNRYGTELFLDWHTNAEYNIDPCAANSTSWGAWGASQAISDLVGDGPDVQEWYDSISAKEGYHDNDSTFDQSIWVTYLFDHSIGANDTLTFYTLFATLHNGSLEDFESNLVDARSWYLDNIRGSACATCCTGSSMGNVDCEGIVDIGDVTELIQLQFIRVGDPFCCEDEADLDYNGDIDIGDLTILINRLFISVTDPPPCPFPPFPPSLIGDYEGIYSYTEIDYGIDTIVDTSQLVTFRFTNDLYLMTIDATIPETLRVFCDVEGVYELLDGVQLTITDPNRTGAVCIYSWNPFGFFGLDQTMDTVRMRHDSIDSGGLRIIKIIRMLKVD
jgi:hypothetical protein